MRIRLTGENNKSKTLMLHRLLEKPSLHKGWWKITDYNLYYYSGDYGVVFFNLETHTLGVPNRSLNDKKLQFVGSEDIFDIELKS